MSERICHSLLHAHHVNSNGSLRTIHRYRRFKITPSFDLPLTSINQRRNTVRGTHLPRRNQAGIQAINSSSIRCLTIQQTQWEVSLVTSKFPHPIYSNSNWTNLIFPFLISMTSWRSEGNLSFPLKRITLRLVIVSNPRMNTLRAVYRLTASSALPLLLFQLLKVLRRKSKDWENTPLNLFRKYHRSSDLLPEHSPQVLFTLLAANRKKPSYPPSQIRRSFSNH